MVVVWGCSPAGGPVHARCGMALGRILLSVVRAGGPVGGCVSGRRGVEVGVVFGAPVWALPRAGGQARRRRGVVDVLVVALVRGCGPAGSGVEVAYGLTKGLSTPRALHPANVRAGGLAGPRVRARRWSSFGVLFLVCPLLLPR